MTRSLSHNADTERALLGGLLTQSSAYPEISAMLGVEDFARPSHQALYRLLGELHRRDGTFDGISLFDEVDRRGCAEQLGGISALVSLSGACPSLAGMPSYAARVKDHSTRRRLQLAAERILEAVETGEADTPSMLADAEAEIYAISKGAKMESSWRTGAELAVAVMANIERRSKNPGLTGLTTGLIDLDDKLCGWQPGQLIVLAARPAMGKTALALHFIRAACAAGREVGMFSLEMGAEELGERMVCADGKVDAGRARSGYVTPDDWHMLGRSADRLHEWRVHIDDGATQTIGAMRSKARALKLANPGLSLIVVDYLQLASGEGKRDTNREAIVSEISRGLKVLAKDLGVPVIALSQLNRSLEARKDKRPMLSDLRESGAIEQDADVVLFLYRDEVYNEDTDQKGTAEIIIGKHRAGEIGMVRTAFAGRFLRFDDLGRYDGGGGYQ